MHTSYFQRISSFNYILQTLHQQLFFVCAKNPKAKICFLVPTASYLAYANENHVYLCRNVEKSQTVFVCDEII